MKNTRSAIAVTLLFAGVTAFVLQIQRAQSNPPPPPPPPAFEDHYSKTSFTIDAAVIDEEGQHVGIKSLTWPIMDRTVRMSLTFHATDGQIAFGEAVVCYKSSTGEFVVQGSREFPLVSIPPPDGSSGIQVSGGPDGTVVFENLHTATGTVHVALWY